MHTLCQLYANKTELHESNIDVYTKQHEVAAAWADSIMKGDKVYSLLHLALSTVHPVQW